jgi:DNA processing protein
MAEGWPTLSDEQRLAWLRLIRTPRIGPALFQDLLNLYGSAQGAIEALPHMSARRGVRFQPADADDIEREMADAAKLGARFLICGEPGYPPVLAYTPRPPPILCALMNATDVSAKPTVALVGARNASAGGLALAKRMATDLGKAGVTVVSGLARGVDAAAHLGSLETGTLAFTAGGLARPYPPEHSDLMARIAGAGGAVYSEMPLTWVARAQDFPKRNRLVAGSSLGVVIVEAAKRSGSLITARQAGEFGRLVMAVPGFPLDPRSDGPNSLIRDGATLVTNADDVLEEIGPLLSQPAKWEPPSDQLRSLGDQLPLLRESKEARSEYEPVDAQGEQAIEQAMGFSPVTADVLIESTGLPTAQVRVWLVENELVGRIVRSAGDRFAWSPEKAGDDYASP